MYKGRFNLLNYEDIICFPCFRDGTFRYLGNNQVILKKFKSTKSLILHLRTNHNLEEEEIKKIKKISKSYNGDGKFLDFCFSEGMRV